MKTDTKDGWLNTILAITVVAICVGFALREAALLGWL
jgi:hypothetical protein